MPETIIQTDQLTRSFNGVQALNALSMDVPAHSIVGFLGPNGAGKSTTIKLLPGLIHPTSGGGTVFGKDIVHESREIRQYVGYLAQQPRFDETMTARQTFRSEVLLQWTGQRHRTARRGVAGAGWPIKQSRPPCERLLRWGNPAAWHRAGADQ